MIPIIRTDFSHHIADLHQTNQKTDDPQILATLSQIRHDIIAKGDAALIGYTQKFDRIDPKTFSLSVSDEEREAAYHQVPTEFIVAIKRAATNIETFHKAQRPKDWKKTSSTGITYGLRYTPIPKVGLYVPGGKAVYPSSILMTAIPAQLAGVEECTLVTPPGPDGTLAPAILVTADILGIKSIYKVGGAQAIFALATGTATLPKVDKIVGPGNIYVTMAKQMVYGQVDIDKPAGPSEVLVYIQDPAYAAFAAADLLCQLEHDPLAVAIAISENETTLQAIQEEITRQLPLLKRQEILAASLKNTALFLSPDLQTSYTLINEVAAEHLVIMTDHPKDILTHVKHAGSVFLGTHTPVTLGDYMAGPNHVLPTGGTARFASPLGVMDFMKYHSYLHYPEKELLACQDELKILTEIEGLDAHFAAVEIRLK